MPSAAAAAPVATAAPEAKAKHGRIPLFADTYIIKPRGLMETIYAAIKRYPSDPAEVKAASVNDDAKDSLARFESKVANPDEEEKIDLGAQNVIECGDRDYTSEWFDKTQCRINIIGFNMVTNNSKLKSGFPYGSDPRTIFIERYNKSTEAWTSVLKQLPDTINAKRINVASVFFKADERIINALPSPRKENAARIYKAVFEKYNEQLRNENNRAPKKEEVMKLLKQVHDQLYSSPEEKKRYRRDVSSFSDRADDLIKAYKKEKINRENHSRS